MCMTQRELPYCNAAIPTLLPYFEKLLPRVNLFISGVEEAALHPPEAADAAPFAQDRRSEETGLGGETIEAIFRTFPTFKVGPLASGV